MLTSDQFDTLTQPILSIFHEYEISVIKDIARRLKNLDFASAAWQAQRLTESGALYKNVLKEIAKLTGQSEKQIADILSRAGVKAIKFDDQIYKDAGLNPIPLNLSPAMLQTLIAGIDKTNGVINNLTKTTALTAQQSFIRASNLAYLQVSTGAMDYNSAIRMAIKDVAAQGLETIDYASGHKDQLDVAIRRNVLTGIGQTANQLQITRAEEMGSDLVGVSAHVGARNRGVGPMNHEGWQGQVYSRSGTSEKYKPFVPTTGYGTGEGLGGWNCRHTFYPFFEGISENAYTQAELKSFANKTVAYNGQNISMYDATQIQREYERKIRSWKRQAAGLEAAGLDNSKEVAKVKEWQSRMRDFIGQTGLDRQYVRESVITPKRPAAPPETVIPPISTAPVEPVAPVEPKALGAPVSGALDTSPIKNKQMKQQVELALREMDKVHGDGVLPKIPITQGAGRNYGQFRFSWSGTPSNIGISMKGDHQALTTLHEIGHFLDCSGTKPQWSSKSIIENSRVVEIAKKSSWWTGFSQRVEDFSNASDIPIRIRLDPKYLSYIRSNKEIFARAYAQFIATESGDAVLLAQLKKLQEQKFPTQWSDADFEPIASEFRKLFRERGWM